MPITTLVTFNGYSGPFAFSAGLALDVNGDIFGGLNGAGIAFEISKTAAGYATTATTLVTFTSAQGSNATNVIIDPAGDLFGTTTQGGASGVGTVFEIVNNSGSYSVDTLTAFTGANGGYPQFGLITDAAGDLFGTTSYSTTGGRLQGGGTVFEMTKTANGYSSIPLTLYTAVSGFYPNSPVVADAAGDLFGEAGVINGSGIQVNANIVYELVNNGAGSYSFSTLASFTPGVGPSGGLVLDKAGDLFGITPYGGNSGTGTVFEIAKSAAGYSSPPTTLVTFTGSNGANPQAALIIDHAGNLFGTTSGGGTATNGAANGTVFEIAKTANGYGSQPITLVNFDGTNGSGPSGPLVADAAGDLFGSTAGSHIGAYGVYQAGNGTVFELTDSPYVACYRQGTAIATPGGERAIETLSPGDLVLTASGRVQPIKWIGHRHIDASAHPKPRTVWPIRFAAGAFGEHRPRCDLFLSPEHAVFVEGALIPARHLVNDTSVTQQAVRDVVYWHVELDRHDILLAENLPCETYLDTGNRHIFDQQIFSGTVTSVAAADEVWANPPCAPLVESGPLLDAARRDLAKRACELGYQPANVLDVTLPTAGRANLTVPAGIEAIRLLSPARRVGNDRRLLGALITGLHIDGAPLPLDDSRLLRGFHDVEHHAARIVRWTDGAATVHIGRAAGTRSLGIEVAA